MNEDFLPTFPPSWVKHDPDEMLEVCERITAAHERWLDRDPQALSAIAAARRVVDASPLDEEARLERHAALDRLAKRVLQAN